MLRFYGDAVMGSARFGFKFMPRFYGIAVVGSSILGFTVTTLFYGVAVAGSGRRLTDKWGGFRGG